MATQAPLDKMLALFERPESEAALVRAGKVPRGWLYDVGGGLYFHSKIPESALREDGSPGRVKKPSDGDGGGSGEAKETMASAMLKFDFTRTMFGGVRFDYFGDAQVGDVLTTEDSTESVRITEGSSGLLGVTTSVKRYFSPRGLVLEQRSQGIAKQTTKPGTKDSGPRARPEPPADTVWERTVTPTMVSLFSYSALTFNRHRIHYDEKYVSPAASSLRPALLPTGLTVLGLR